MLLKLKKIHILGFKSFCDRTELTVPGRALPWWWGPMDAASRTSSTG
jgi:chromosome segregation protein